MTTPVDLEDRVRRTLSAVAAEPGGPALADYPTGHGSSPRRRLATGGLLAAGAAAAIGAGAFALSAGSGTQTNVTAAPGVSGAPVATDGGPATPKPTAPPDTRYRAPKVRPTGPVADPTTSTGLSEAWPSGILPYTFGPFSTGQYHVRNRWQDLVPAQQAHVQVFAGSLPATKDVDGFVMLEVVSLQSSQVLSSDVTTVSGSGALRVIQASYPSFILANDSGKRYRYDAVQHRVVAL